MRDVMRVARKEFRGFFASPAAWLFLGAFLAVSLFVVFWVETFFARNIADLRPLFTWLPLLLIFLVAALTMRAWSEERRAGTLESLLTAPVRPLQLVLGKFLAALALVALALALTLPLPVTVAQLGPLDPGPVIGGYLAALFLAAAYIAIGLYVSSRTDNPIVALILTLLIGGALYLVGESALTSLVGYRAGAVLAQLGTGARFASITRGVLDLRDLYYYLALVGVFLTLNLLALERLRWQGTGGGARLRARQALALLVVANLLAANLWLAPITAARVDLTDGNRYSLSESTEAQLERLAEPLLIRGYFSARTHPLLAPLVPQLQDLLREYAVAGGERVRVEFIDPQRDPALEEEAASRYGIQPLPFQTADRYQASVVSAYFDVVIGYGDQYQTLGFRDLIEVKSRGEADLDVALNNPEYAITRAVRRVVDSYRVGGEPFAELPEPVVFRGYFSPVAQLPEVLGALREEVLSVVRELQAQSGGRLQVDLADPAAGDGALAAQLAERYGLTPQVAGLLEPEPFWFAMQLQAGDRVISVPLPDTLDRDALRRTLLAAAQRLAPGFLKTVAVLRPPPGFGPGGGQASYAQLTQRLGESVRLEETQLQRGQVPDTADLLLVLAPEALTPRQVYAIDQFLMRGGSVVLASAPYAVQVDQTLSARPVDSGLAQWLAHLGVRIDEAFVLDPQNTALPVPTTRTVGGLQFQEVRMMPYPHFPDVRGEGLAEHPATASLDQLTMNWVSPVRLLEAAPGAQDGVEATVLLRSSPRSWTLDQTDLVPDFTRYPQAGFPVTGERAAQPLAVALAGPFRSYFEAPPPADGGEQTGAAQSAGEDLATLTGHIERAPASARLVVIASNTFASDMALQLTSQGLETFYDQPIALLQNLIDWSLEDPALLALRGRTQFARTLRPLPPPAQARWEYLNYALALAGLLLVWLWRRWVARQDRRRYRRILGEAGA